MHVSHTVRDCGNLRTGPHQPFLRESTRKIVESYVEGLCWVLSYYYQGVQDWSWYFPFHYAPFASDFDDISNIQIKWDRKATPRKPLEQLMCVFPAASGQVILICTTRPLLVSTIRIKVSF